MLSALLPALIGALLFVATLRLRSPASMRPDRHAIVPPAPACSKS